MKKIIAFIMTLVVLFATVPVLGVSASSTPTFVVDSVEGEPGETVSVNVSTKNNSGIVSMKLNVKYDASVLELVDQPVGGAFENVIFGPSTANPIVINWVNTLSPNNTTDGVVATLTFRVLDTATEGESNLTLTYDEDDVYDKNYDNVYFDIVNGSVTVKYPLVPVMGVTIDENMSLKTGETKTPTFAVNPANASDKTVSFKSDNTGVAIVNEKTGEVTGISKGIAVITVTTQDGGFSDFCTVTVACAHAHQTSIGEKASDCKTEGWDAYKKCDDCGQLLATDGISELVEIPYRALSDEHTGGTATCTQPAICSVCGHPYGNLADHDYTEEAEDLRALKTAGTCCQAAEYWYSCSTCGQVEGNDSHTFLGDKNKDNHTGGTTIVKATDANHKEQKDGYTGDTQCLGCGSIIEYGDPIFAGGHETSDDWSSDEQYNWKACTVVGCGVVIDSTKMEHTSSGENVATCQKRAVCDVCGASYGTVAAHAYDEDWSKDETGHWHACLTEGCTDKKAFAGHTPDHEGGATEEYPIKCTVCGFIMEQRLPHNHVFTQEVVDAQYLASNATCMQPAKYYFSCACGQKGTETFTHGDPVDHMENGAWEADKENHWHTCAFDGCDHVFTSSKASHTPDREAATETEAVKCSVCGYEIEPALGHTHAFGEKWEKNENSHWHACACGEKTDVADHVDENKDGECDFCAYSMSIPTVPTEPEKSTEPVEPTAPTEQTKPTEPSTTAEPEATETVTTTGSAVNEKPSESPKTGDGSMILLWSILILLGGLGLAMLILSDKKRKTE